MSELTLTKNQVRKALETVAPGQYSPGRLQGLAKKMSNDDLLQMVLSCDAIIDQVNRDRDIYLTELGCRFPAERASEFIISKKGVAERKVTTDWVVNTERLADLKEKLGRSYSLLIKEEEKWQVIPEKVLPLRLELGDDYADYFAAETKYKVAREFQNEIKASEELRAEMEGMIYVVQKVSVKVKPVGVVG